MNRSDRHQDIIERTIRSTKFVFMVAQSGVGKTFWGDYLEAIQGWKHIDGDLLLKNASSNPEYKNATDQFWRKGIYAEKAAEDEAWAKHESWKPYTKILARLTIEGAYDSDMVVLTHASYCNKQRTYLREQLIEAGARNISTVFLHCDFDAHMRDVWNRWNRLADHGDTTVEEIFRVGFGIERVVDFDSFVKIQKILGSFWEEPDESDKPFQVVDVSAKDVSVFDNVDKVFGAKSNSRRGLTQKQIVKRIQLVRKNREQSMSRTMNASQGSLETLETEIDNSFSSIESDLSGQRHFVDPPKLIADGKGYYFSLKPRFRSYNIQTKQKSLNDEKPLGRRNVDSRWKSFFGPGKTHR